MRVPLILTIVLVAIACAAGTYIATTSKLSLTDAELVQAEISIFATMGALISATFVIYSYIQTNRAFIDSHRPQLLIWVESKKLRKEKDSDEEIPATFIHYKNITANQFSDLTINVSALAENRTFDLGGLFRTNMIMIGYDQRTRFFETLNTLRQKGLDIDAVAARGKEVILRLSYSYTYLGKRHTVECQNYKWDPRIQQWIIA